MLYWRVHLHHGLLFLFKTLYYEETLMIQCQLLSHYHMNNRINPDINTISKYHSKIKLLPKHKLKMGQGLVSYLNIVPRYYLVSRCW